MERILLSAVIRIDFTTKRKHSNKHITVNSKVILNRSKNGHKVRKTVQDSKNQKSKIDIAIFISTK